MVMIDIDPERLEAVAAELSSTPQEVEQAFRRSLTRVAQQVRVRGARAIGLRTGSFLRNRVKTGTGANGEPRIWFGLNPVLASGFITPSKARAQMRARNGVTVRGKHYPKGFQIGRRRGAETSRDFLAVTRDGRRLRPIRVDIESEARPALAAISRDIPQLFEEEFLRLLTVRNYRNQRVR